jgi:hypothetical protein
MGAFVRFAKVREDLEAVDAPREPLLSQAMSMPWEMRGSCRDLIDRTTFFGHLREF